MCENASGGAEIKDSEYVPGGPPLPAPSMHLKECH